MNLPPLMFAANLTLATAADSRPANRRSNRNEHPSYRPLAR